MPLYRDSAASESNILPGLLEILQAAYGKRVSAEDFAGYVYALLAHPEYTRRFAKELGGRAVRVPLTKDGALFFEAAALGRSLLWLHTYGQRLADKAHPAGKIPRGKAKCKKAVSDSEEQYPETFSYDEASETLFVGDGAFGPVSSAVYAFEVSGLQVVKSWLGYRMKHRSGRRSSPLDDIRPRQWSYAFTRELLELLWVLETTIDGYRQQIALFDRILKSRLFLAEQLPAVPEAMRQPPHVARATPQREIEFSD